MSTSAIVFWVAEMLDLQGDGVSRIQNKNFEGGQDTESRSCKS